MSPFARAAAVFGVVALAGAALTLGCDVLFPEFGGSSPPDASVYDGGGGDAGDDGPRLVGTVCILGDLRDYRSCAAGAPGVLRITVEETRQQTMTDAAGHFTLPLATPLGTATVAAVDPRGNFATTVAPVRLQNGVALNLALPVVDAQALANAALANGMTLDPQRGVVLGWVVDGSGAPVAGAAAAAQPSLLVDGPAVNELDPGTATHAHGALALFDAAPTSVTLQVTPPPSLPLSGDSFTLPVRAGAVTLTTLYLPPR